MVTVPLLVMQAATPEGRMDAARQSAPATCSRVCPVAPILNSGPPYQTFCVAIGAPNMATGPFSVQPTGKIVFKGSPGLAGGSADSRCCRTLVGPPAFALSRSNFHLPAIVGGKSLPGGGGTIAGRVRTPASRRLPSGLTAYHSSCWSGVMGKVAIIRDSPDSVSSLTTP